MARHKVHTHLDIPDGWWKFSLRQILLVVLPFVFLVADVYKALPSDGPALGDVLYQLYPRLGWLFAPGSLPVVPLLGAGLVWAPFLILALPLNPPAEHGLFALVGWIRTHGYRAPEQVADELGELVVNGDRVESNFGFHAVWEMPTNNLRSGGTADVELAEDQWGDFATGLTWPAQALVRATQVDPEPMVSSIATYTPPGRGQNGATAKSTAHRVGQPTPAANARELADWLRKSMRTEELIERRYFLAIFGEDEQTFRDNEMETSEAISILGFRANYVRRLEGDELRAVVQRGISQRAAGDVRWTTRKGKKHVGLGTADRAFNAVGAWYADGEWHIVLALGKWWRLIRDNALAPYVDGPHQVDVMLYIEPLDADSVLGPLERRSESMKISEQAGMRWRKRKVAIDDLDEFVLAIEGGDEAPFDVAMYLHVHASTRKQAERLAKRILKRLKQSGAEGRRMPWEQSAAVANMLPLGMNRLARRTRRVTTSVIKNMYVYTASTCWMDRAVPLGYTLESKRPVGLNTWYQPTLPNPQMAVYAIAGAGKGFLVKVLLERELFAGLTQEIFGFDQAPEDLLLGEYGRFAAHCGIEYRHVKDESDFAAALADMNNTRWLGPGLIWNIAQLDVRLRPEFVAKVKAALWKRSAERRANRKLNLDEMWDIVKKSSDLGCDPYWLAMCLAGIEELVRLGRHMHLGAVVQTQRVKDSVELPIMQVIQEICSTQFYGMQLASSLSDVAPRLHWTDGDVKQIKRLQNGEFLLQTGPWRVALKVHASDAEYAMANTDNLAPEAKAA